MRRFNVAVRILAIALTICLLWENILWANPEINSLQIQLPTQTLINPDAGYAMFIKARVAEQVALFKKQGLSDEEIEKSHLFPVYTQDGEKLMLHTRYEKRGDKWVAICSLEFPGGLRESYDCEVAISDTQEPAPIPDRSTVEPADETKTPSDEADQDEPEQEKPSELSAFFLWGGIATSAIAAALLWQFKAVPLSMPEYILLWIAGTILLPFIHECGHISGHIIRQMLINRKYNSNMELTPLAGIKEFGFLRKIPFL